MAPERIPLPDVPTGSFFFNEANPPCFCGTPGSEEFRGWWLCSACAPGVKRAWRKANRPAPKMATSLRTRR